MKIIHCADLHLDSKMNTHLDKDRAKQRRGEIINTFIRMVEYASDNEVGAILIAGDLFDTGRISKTARNTVLHAVVTHPGINFYYLAGNHDNDNFTSESDEPLPDNLKLFGDEWTVYDEAGGKITVTGIEPGKTGRSRSAFSGTDTDSASQTALPLPDPGKFNIVMLHGQITETASGNSAEFINLNAYRYKNIDYLALGHIHFFKEEKLDPRCTWCYPGCLEGRGFDECGEHGFVLLDIDEEKLTYTHTFVPFAMRRLYEVEVDASGLESTAQMAAKASRCVDDAGCGPDDMVKFVLTGEIDVECEKDIVHFEELLKQDHFFIKAEDRTTYRIDPEDYRLDESLKGEFVRQVLDDPDLDDEDRMKVIRFGLQALAGEEIQ